MRYFVWRSLSATSYEVGRYVLRRSLDPGGYPSKSLRLYNMMCVLATVEITAPAYLSANTAVVPALTTPQNQGAPQNV